MTQQDRLELAAALESIGELERYAGCSDLFFRQVFTQKIRAILAGGYIEKLRSDGAQERAD
ncbi:MAG: hypothetical protein ACI4MP_06790 [Candidatus Ventricola sp.]